MNKLVEGSCKEFTDKLASNAPTPGGGGAAAMAGALAGALSAMVAELTIGKKGFDSVEAEITSLLGEANKQRILLLELVEQDAAVFADFMSCYKLPKSTEAEKAARSNAIREAAKRAAMVPMNIARACAEIVSISDKIAKIGNPNVITDATCSALLGRAALRCAVYNVYINLGLTKDEAFNNALRQETSDLERIAEAAEQNVLVATDKALA